MLQFNEQFDNAPDIVRNRMLGGLNAQLALEEHRSTAAIRDPPEMNGRRRRMFGRGGTRRLTGAEIAEKELQRNDKLPVTKESSVMSVAAIDLTIPTISPQRSGPIFMSFSRSGAMIRRSDISPVRIQQREEPVRRRRREEEEEVVVLEMWSEDEVLAEGNTASDDAQISHQEKQISIPSSIVDLSSETSSPRPHRQVGRCSIYQGELVQPRKRVKR